MFLLDRIKMVDRRIWKWLLFAVIIFLAMGSFFYAYAKNYEDKVYGGIEVGGVDLGGKNKEQAKVLIQAKIDNLTKDGVKFVYDNNEFDLLPIVSIGETNGSAYELWFYDLNKNLENIYMVGREGSFLKRLVDQASYLINGHEIAFEFEFNKDKVVEILKDRFVEFENPGKDAEFVFKDEKVYISEEETGLAFDYEKIADILEGQLKYLDNSSIKIELEADTPKVTKAKSEFLLDDVDSIFDKAPITLNLEIPEDYTGWKHFDSTQWLIDKEQLQELLDIKLNDKKKVSIGLDQDKMEEYLKTIAEDIDTPAKDAKFEVKNGRVAEWQSSTDGFVLNIESTINFIEDEFFEKDNNNIDLVLSIDKSKITNDNVNDLGIDELLGTGISNFSGSPVNRRHNIAVGAEALNGLLIKPNEEFSLLAALGEINAESGYKPELVIKEGETIAEYGGGLCQIGTTLFRSVLDTGLPVTQRRNHSYRVSYYEPAGTDATIYDPWPDFRFVNDTENYVLLQTRIEGNELIFDFWGTSDGRKVEMTKPVIYNITAPGEPKEIETDTLAPGEKVKKESAHYGADAYFTRTITWPEEMNKEVFEETYNSHYVPWQEVWLVGKSDDIATSTEEIIEE